MLKQTMLIGLDRNTDRNTILQHGTSTYFDLLFRFSVIFLRQARDNVPWVKTLSHKTRRPPNIVERGNIYFIFCAISHLHYANSHNIYASDIYIQILHASFFSLAVIPALLNYFQKVECDFKRKKKDIFFTQLVKGFLDLQKVLSRKELLSLATRQIYRWIFRPGNNWGCDLTRHHTIYKLMNIACELKIKKT